VKLVDLQVKPGSPLWNDLGLQTVSEGPLQAKQFHLRFIEKEREREGQGGSRKRRGKGERERESGGGGQGGLSLYMDDVVITGKGGR
jgi:hypothetical protein